MTVLCLRQQLVIPSRDSTSMDTKSRQLLPKEEKDESDFGPVNW